MNFQERYRILMEGRTGDKSAPLSPSELIQLTGPPAIIRPLPAITATEARNLSMPPITEAEMNILADMIREVAKNGERGIEISTGLLQNRTGRQHTEGEMSWICKDLKANGFEVEQRGIVLEINW